jgi:RNA polymerase sigma factor (sigma-70 family)
LSNEELDIILEHCRLNHRPSQEKLYKYYYADMFRLCQRYMPDPHIALSILNDAFLKAFQNIGKYQESLGNFKSWLKTIIINTAIDYLRKYKKDMRLIHIDIDMVQEKGNEDFHLNYQWKHEELMQYLLQLPSVTRTVLNLFAFDGFSHKEIALQLDISETTSRWHLAEARKRLRQSMQLISPKLAKHE